jgi:hypothetical protein
MELLLELRVIRNRTSRWAEAVTNQKRPSKQANGPVGATSTSASASTAVPSLTLHIITNPP